MIKKIFILLFVITWFSFSLLQPSDAFFLGKKKAGQVGEGEGKDNRILVVEIYAGWCPACKNIQPTLDLLQDDVKDINFVKLDVSTPSKASESAELAKKLGIEEFYKLNKSKTSTVAIFKPQDKKLVTVFQNNNDIDEYKSAIDDAKNSEAN